MLKHCAAPLACDDTGSPSPDEERFLAWLVREKHMTLGSVRAHRLASLELQMRREFARLHGNDVEMPQTPPRKRTVQPTPRQLTPSKKIKASRWDVTCDHKPTLKPTVGSVERQIRVVSSPAYETQRKAEPNTPPTDAAVRWDEIQPIVGSKPPCSCSPMESDSPTNQCIRHLQTAIHALAATVKSLEKNHDEHPDPAQITTKFEVLVPNRNDDAILIELVHTYEEINERIVLNEKALQEEDARLTEDFHETANLHEAIQLQWETDELRNLVRSEYATRSTAVAMLLLFAYRDDFAVLRKMLYHPNAPACDVPFIQRRTHATCAALIHDGTATLSILPRRSRLLEELTRLVPFDASVRRAIRGLLTAVALVSSPTLSIPTVPGI